MIHDASRRRKDDIAKLTRRQQFHHPLLQLVQPNIVSWGDDARLVEATRELSDTL